jgi:type I restriction enzyme R subunit
VRYVTKSTDNRPMLSGNRPMIIRTITIELLRYGADVQVSAGQPHYKMHLIDWDSPEKNDFALAEE